MFTQGLEGGLTGETEAGRPANVGARGPCKGGEEVQWGTPGDQGIPRVEMTLARVYERGPHLGGQTPHSAR